MILNLTQYQKKEIKKISSVKDVTALRTIRKSVLYERLPDFYAIYDEDFDKETKHYIIIYKKKIVTGASLIKKPYSLKNNLKSYQIRGMFTQKLFRKLGFGSHLIKYLLSLAKKDDNMDILWCNSRRNAVDFYINNGFIKSTGFFLIKKIGIHNQLFLDCR
mgnify:CR=1 FL=1